MVGGWVREREVREREVREREVREWEGGEGLEERRRWARLGEDAGCQDKVCAAYVFTVAELEAEAGCGSGHGGDGDAGVQGVLDADGGRVGCEVGGGLATGWTLESGCGLAVSFLVMLAVRVSGQREHLGVTQRADVCNGRDGVLCPLTSGTVSLSYDGMANGFLWIVSPFYACLRVDYCVDVGTDESIQQNVHPQRLCTVSQTGIEVCVEVRCYV